MSVVDGSEARAKSSLIGLGRMRDPVKKIVEHAATLPGLMGTIGLLRRREVAILAYHNVIPNSEPVTGERPLHISFDTFRRHLDALERHFRVCPLEELLRPGEANGPGQLRVAITFDDAYAGALRLGVPELVHRGLPATIFAPPGLLGTPVFWWDAYELSSSERSGRCLVALRGDGGEIDSWARTDGRQVKAPGPSQRPGTKEELVEAADHPGITVGVHGFTHSNLAVLTQSEVAKELNQCTATLERLGIDVLPFVAYPYGLSSPSVEAVVKAGPLKGGLMIEGGTFRRGLRDPDPTRVPRISIPAQASAQNLLLRVLGLITT
jgi:peptidoglycan/xylan/chitin deacetylase (PgdA/CDA1 family)